MNDTHRQLISSERTPDSCSSFWVFLNEPWTTMHYFIIHFPSFKMDIWRLHTTFSSLSQILEGIDSLGEILRSFVNPKKRNEIGRKKIMGQKQLILSVFCPLSSDVQPPIPNSSYPLFSIFSGEKQDCGYQRRNTEISPTLDQDPRAHLLRGLKSGKL